MKRTDPFAHFGAHLRRRMVSGLLVVLPLGITYFVVRFAVGAIAGALRPLLEHYFPQLHPATVLAASVAAFLALLYLLGLFTTHVIGQKFVGLGEFILMRVPMIRSIYGASKQVVQTFSGQDRVNYRHVAMFDFPRAGIKSLGFVTGEIRTPDGTDCYRLFMPTAPNPTTGFVMILPKTDVILTDMGVEDAFRTIISGGIIGPERIGLCAIPGRVPSSSAV